MYENVRNVSTYACRFLHTCLQMNVKAGGDDLAEKSHPLSLIHILSVSISFALCIFFHEPSFKSFLD